MNNITDFQILLGVNAYLLFALAVFWFSAKNLVCRFSGSEPFPQHRVAKTVVAVPLVLGCLAILAGGLFVIGLSHGSRPDDYQVVLFILGCLLPVILLIIWVVGSAWVDALWIALITTLLCYLLFINSALYVRLWADSNVQWAQMWMAENYSTGHGGLVQSDSTARRWYRQAALGGNPDAQYKMAITARRSKEANKWYLMAAEQGHAEAMIQMSRLARSDEERQRWLEYAVDTNHPEAVFMLAKKSMASDLPKARRLLLEAAENGSRRAIIFLIEQYKQGGVLFDQDPTSASQWLSVLESTPVSTIEPTHLTKPSIDVTITQAPTLGDTIKAGDVVTLYKQAKIFLNHPAKDQILHDRAVDYLERAAGDGHGESALELARLLSPDNKSIELNADAIKWYQIAAQNGNLPALKKWPVFINNKKTHQYPCYNNHLSTINIY